MDFFQRIKYGEAIRDDRGIVVLLKKDRTKIQEIMECLQKLRSTVRRMQLGNRFAIECDAIVVIIFVGPPQDSEPILFVLEVSPDQVVQRPQWVDLQHPEWIQFARALQVERRLTSHGSTQDRG